MSEVTNELLYEVLKNVQSDTSALKSDVSVLKESVRRIDGRLAAMDHYMAGFNAEQRWQNDELDHIKDRITTLEEPAPDPEKG